MTYPYSGFPGAGLLPPMAPTMLASPLPLFPGSYVHERNREQNRPTRSASLGAGSPGEYGTERGAASGPHGSRPPDGSPGAASTTSVTYDDRLLFLMLYQQQQAMQAQLNQLCLSMQQMHLLLSNTVAAGGLVGGAYSAQQYFADEGIRGGTEAFHAKRPSPSWRLDEMNATDPAGRHMAVDEQGEDGGAEVTRGTGDRGRLPAAVPFREETLRETGTHRETSSAPAREWGVAAEDQLSKSSYTHVGAAGLHRERAVDRVLGFAGADGDGHSSSAPVGPRDHRWRHQEREGFPKKEIHSSSTPTKTTAAEAASATDFPLARSASATAAPAEGRQVPVPSAASTPLGLQRAVWQRENPLLQRMAPTSKVPTPFRSSSDVSTTGYNASGNASLSLIDRRPLFSQGELGAPRSEAPSRATPVAAWRATRGGSAAVASRGTATDDSQPDLTEPGRFSRDSSGIGVRAAAISNFSRLAPTGGTSFSSPTTAAVTKREERHELNPTMAADDVSVSMADESQSDGYGSYESRQYLRGIGLL